MFRPFLILFAVFLSINIKAQFVLNSCPEYSPMPFPLVHIWDHESLTTPTCDVVRDLAEVYSSVSEFAPQFQVRRVFISAEAFTFSMTPSNTLLIAPRYQVRDHVHSLGATKVVFAHELGHGLLNDLLREELPILNDLIEEELEISKLYDKLFSINEAIDEIKNGLSNALSENEKEQIKNQIFQLVSEQKAILEEAQKKEEGKEANEHYAKFYEILSPYHELFADIVAIFYMSDPQAMYKALTYDGIDPELDHSFQAMDFTINHDLESWNETIVHNLLAPVRYHIWKNYLQRNMSEIDRPEFLLGIKDAIAKIVIERYDIEANLEVSPSTVDINKELINVIDQTLKTALLNN